MALFARAAKLGSGTYGARHARVWLSVMQWILAIWETVVIKLCRLNIVTRGLFNCLPHSLSLPLYTPLSRVGSDQAAGKRAGGVHYEKKERLCIIYTSHTPCKASLMVSQSTTLVPSLRLCIAPAHEAGLSTGMCHLVKERKKQTNKERLCNGQVL